MTHSNLIDRCKRGDRRAQNDLFRDFGKPMYHVILRMVGNADDAHELLQQTFIKVFQKLDQFQGEGHPGGWIKRIAITTTLNHLNRRKHMDDLEDHHMAVPEETQEADVPRVSAAQIHAAVQELPTSARVVVTLHLLENYRHTEIAELLNISASTSRSQYLRGRQLLQQKLSALIES